MRLSSRKFTKVNKQTKTQGGRNGSGVYSLNLVLLKKQAARPNHFNHRITKCQDLEGEITASEGYT